MLDLLGQREEALERYQKVLAMAIEKDFQHEQYQISHGYDDYAGQRMLKPFSRIENLQP